MNNQKQNINIIGLDAAVQEKNTGCIFGRYNRGSFTVKDRWDQKEPLTETMTRWIKDSGKAILAIDAPLGWPISYRRTLEGHVAGKPLNIDPESFFKRKTDLDIRQRFNKTTLEISADRIARTAFFTLGKIGNVAKLLNDELHLLWDVRDLNKYGMIEVYPAATLLANRLSIKGYKKKNNTIRKELYQKLQTNYKFSNPKDLDLTTIEHDFDAFLCCLACIDFIIGKASAPPFPDADLREEGWIWVKQL